MQCSIQRFLYLTFFYTFISILLQSCTFYLSVQHRDSLVDTAWLRARRLVIIFILMKWVFLLTFVPLLFQNNNNNNNPLHSSRFCTLVISYSTPLYSRNKHPHVPALKIQTCLFLNINHTIQCVLYSHANLSFTNFQQNYKFSETLHII